MMLTDHMAHMTNLKGKGEAEGKTASTQHTNLNLQQTEQKGSLSHLWCGVMWRVMPPASMLAVCSSVCSSSC